MAVRRQTSNKQILYLELYNAGFSMGEIADHFGVGRSTISRTLKRARRLTCPFTPNCEKCPLSECAFKPEYASLINNPERADKNRAKGEPVEEALKKILEQQEVQEEPTEKFVYQTPTSEKVDMSQKKEGVEPATKSEVEKPKRKRGRPKKSDVATSKEESTAKTQEPLPNFTTPHKETIIVSKPEPTYRPWEHPTPKRKQKIPDDAKIIRLPSTTRDTVPKPKPKPVVPPPKPDRIEPRDPPIPFAHRPLMMSDGEIRQHFRLAKDQYEDIKILAELNGTSRDVIRGILGVDPPKPKNKKHSRTKWK